MKEQFGNIRLIGNMLHIDCRIYGVRVRYGSKLKDTPRNREKLEVFFDSIEDALENGTFRYKIFFPRAKVAELKKFADIEARLFKERKFLQNEITLNEYIEQWFIEEQETLNVSTKIDYQDLLKSRICPMIGHLLFSEINSRTLKIFVRNLKHVDGPKNGEYLSGRRMRNLLTLFQRIYAEAHCEFGWNLNNPFPIAFNRVKKIEKLILDKGLKHDKTREVWLLSEWLLFIVHVPLHYRPFFEALRTGMIFSELKAMKKTSVIGDKLEVNASISRGIEKQCGKTTYRGREITLTKRMRTLIDQASQSSQTDYLFTMADGVTPLNYTTIREDIWEKALKTANLPHKKMYSLRHTFIGWMVLVGMDSVRLKNESGHSSRSTLTEDTYGDFRKGLLEEKEEILNFLGRDVLAPEEFKKSFPHIYLQENGIEIACKGSAVELSAETMSVLANMVASQVGTVSNNGLNVDCTFSSLINSQADNYARKVS